MTPGMLLEELWCCKKLADSSLIREHINLRTLLKWNIATLQQMSTTCELRHNPVWWCHEIVYWCWFSSDLKCGVIVQDWRWVRRDVTTHSSIKWPPQTSTCVWFGRLCVNPRLVTHLPLQREETFLSMTEALNTRMDRSLQVSPAWVY